MKEAHFKIISIYVLIVLCPALFVASFESYAALAANPEISYEFEQTPFFNEENYFPGDSVTRSVEVSNNTDISSSIGILVSDFNVCSEDSPCLPEVMEIEIFRNDSSVYRDDLINFFTNEIADLGVIPSKSDTRFDVKISLDPDAGNEYQGESTNFDLAFFNTSFSSPVVSAKWEQLPWEPREGFIDAFDQTHPSTHADHYQKKSGAQFRPTGVWETEREYQTCAIVTHDAGASAIDRVFSNTYYPKGIAFHAHPDHPDQDLGGQAMGNPVPTTPDLVTYPTEQVSPGPDVGFEGCGMEVQDQSELFKLSKDEGIELFCNYIMDHNTNLPTFYGEHAYDSICGPDGQLEKETSAVYCSDEHLIWEDPAGEYEVHVTAQDTAGNNSAGEYRNYFEYLPMTALEADFESVDYGTVLLNTHKITSGSLTWNDGRPSVRNVGNTRLYVGVEQDDMGLGTTGGEWNVRFDARVGNNIDDWRYYYPTHRKGETPLDQFQLVEDILDLSEIEEMEFGVMISEFPEDDEDWGGMMYLRSSPAPFRQCEPTS